MWFLSFAAAGAGAVSALSCAPRLWWWAPILAFAALQQLLRRAPAGRRPAAIIGGAFYFGYFALGLHWVGNALRVQPELFEAFVPAAVIGLPLALSLFYAASFAVFAPVLQRRPITAPAAAIALAEVVRAHAFTGFPWNAPAQWLGVDDRLLQLLSLGNAEAWNFPVLLWWLTPGALLLPNVRHKRLLALLWLAAALAARQYGSDRLATTPPPPLPIKIMAVQHGIAQRERMQPGGAQRVFEKLLELSENAPDDVTHIIWPESALPPTRNPEPLLQALERHLHADLIVGAAVFPADETQQPHNALLLTEDGHITAYNKVHLVPFGEYLPFPQLLSTLGLHELVRVQGGFAAGTVRPALEAPRTPAFLPLICYEAVFADEAVRDPGQPAPKWAIQITNDAWFGDGDGPEQHFLQARMRAVENGLSLVRVAATGISAVIDPFGRVSARLPMNESGALIASVPSRAQMPLLRVQPKITMICQLIFAVFRCIIRPKESNSRAIARVL